MFSRPYECNVEYIYIYSRSQNSRIYTKEFFYIILFDNN